MDLILPTLFAALLLGCSYYDWKLKQVPDLLTASLWLSLIAPGPNETTAALLMTSGGLFAGFYFMNALALAAGKKFFLSWADVLGVPPFAAIMAVLLSASPLAIISPILISLLVSGARKEKTPLFPFLVGAFALVIALSAMGVKV